MAATTPADRAQGVAEDIKVLLDGKPSGTVVRRKLGTLVNNAGYSRATAAFLDQLTHALGQAGVHADCAPNDPSVTAGSWLRFGRAPFPPTPLLFARERDLEDFVVGSLGTPGRFANLKLIGTQHRVGADVIDILAEERQARSGKRHLAKLVVIEVKKNADEGVVLQTLRYLDAVAARAGGRPVRGIIVTGPGGAAHASTFEAHGKPTYALEWLTYEVSFTRAALHTPERSK